MWRSYLYFAVISLCLLAGACSTGPAAEPNQTLAIPDSTTSITAGDLRIGAMDKLKITVFDVDNLSGIYQVDYAGFVNLPLIEDVKAIGLTSSELAAQLETRYGAKMLQDPDITVSIEESLGRRVTVDGSVSKPGIFPILGEVTLIQAIALAGGPSENANPKKVVVFRTIDAERRAAAFDLTAIRNGTAEDPAIYGNDVIVVDGSEARRTYGEVLRSIPLFALFLAF